MWWCALLALVANDHLLKGAHLLPDFVTGKLSDVAGLIVAPVLAAALLRGGLRRRALGFALVVVPFVAINVSTSAAAGVEAFTAFVGVPWQIWSDPTDLLTLVVLPVSWRLCEPRRVALDLRRPAIALGSIACIATSMPIGPSTQAFIVNHTGAQQTVRARFLVADVDCDGLENRIADALSRDLFGEGTTYTIRPNEVLPLNRGAFDPECDAVLLNIDGMPETIAFWRDVPLREVESTMPDATEDLRRGAIQLLSLGTDVRIETREVTLVESRDRIAGVCTSGPAYDWTAPVSAQLLDAWTITGNTTTLDGCRRVDIESSTERSETLFLCLPEWAFPFQVGEEVQVRATDYELHVIGDTAELRVDQMSGDTRYFGHRARLEAGECGARTECGAYVVPAELTIGGAVVTPEREVELVDGNGRLTVGVGRAEHIITASPDCEPARNLARLYAEIVLLREELE